VNRDKSGHSVISKSMADVELLEMVVSVVNYLHEKEGPRF
jgi:hypothetical protein